MAAAIKPNLRKCNQRGRVLTRPSSLYQRKSDMASTPWNTNPPPHLYKLLSPLEADHSFRWLETPEVFLKRADLFEDQNDCSVPIAFATSTPAKRRAYLEQISTRDTKAQGLSRNRLKAEFRKRETEIPNDQAGRIAFDKKRARKHAKGFAILSLTETIQEEALWNKYAANHSGFGIDFHGLALAIYLNSFPLGIVPVKVEYRDEIQPFDISYGMSGEGYGDIMRIKDKNTWRFEKEWRMIYYGFKPNASSPDEKIRFIDKGVVIAIPDDLIANVYLGRNADPLLEERIQNILSKKAHPIRLIRNS